MTWLLPLTELVLAQAEGGAPEGGGAGGGMMGMLPLVLMFVVIYFLLIRPASKQRKEHASLLNSLKKDDEVVTSGGIYGKIRGLDEKVVTLEIANNVKIRILRERINGRWNAGADAAQKQ